MSLRCCVQASPLTRLYVIGKRVQARRWGLSVSAVSATWEEKSLMLWGLMWCCCISTDPKQMAAHANQLDFILNTVAAPHNLDPFLQLLKLDGTMTLVGAPAEPHPSPGVFNLIFKRRQLAGSLIGGVRETQEMLDFCAQHKIVSDIEVIPMDYINTAYERMLKSDVKYRFVIDMAKF